MFPLGNKWLIFERGISETFLIEFFSSHREILLAIYDGPVGIRDLLVVSFDPHFFPLALGRNYLYYLSCASARSEILFSNRAAISTEFYHQYDKSVC